MPLLVPPLLLLLFVHHCAPIPILPFASLHLDRPAAQPALVHLSNGPRTILRIHHADEAVSSRLVVCLVSTDLCHDEGWVLGTECFGQIIVPQILGQIAHKQPKVVLRPLREGRIDPSLTRSRSLGRLGSTRWRWWRRRRWWRVTVGHGICRHWEGHWRSY